LHLPVSRLLHIINKKNLLNKRLFIISNSDKLHQSFKRPEKATYFKQKNLTTVKTIFNFKGFMKEKAEEKD